MYCWPKMYKITGARFIVASKNCSTKPLSDVISKVLKMTFNYVESFHRISNMLWNWVLKNSFLIVTKLNLKYIKKKSKSISTFDFTTLYMTKPQKVVEDTSQDKLWGHLISHNKMLFYHWKPSVQIIDWHSYGHRQSSIMGKPLFYIYWNLNLFSKFHGTSKID